MSAPRPATARASALAALLRAALADGAGAAREAAFRVLYGLPAGDAPALAAAALCRALPAFEAEHPGVAWPRELLDDPAAWVGRRGRAAGEEPEGAGPAAAAFLLGVDALLAAAAHPDHPAAVAAGAAAAAAQAAEALALAAWAAADPQAVALWRRAAGADDGAWGALDELAARGPQASQAAAAARGLAWIRFAADALDAGAAEAPPADPQALERELARWKDREMMPIVPGTGPDDGTPHTEGA
jgi:hypothetical protein